MTQSDVRMLKTSNVQWIQPGIESLCTRHLGLLKKGVSAIQNLALLKWCREQGIEVSWNLLCGIPGEHQDDYEAQMRLMNHIPHFTPPGLSPIRVDRYSPYFKNPEEYGWTKLTPFGSYRFMHPQLNEEALVEIAYHFDAIGGPDLGAYYRALDVAVRRWQRRHTAGDGLFWDETIGLVRISEGQGSMIERDSLLDRLIEQTHEITTIHRLLTLRDVTTDLIDQLVDQGVLYREGDRVINLAVRVPDVNPPESTSAMHRTRNDGQVLQTGNNLQT